MFGRFRIKNALLSMLIFVELVRCVTRRGIIRKAGRRGTRPRWIHCVARRQKDQLGNSCLETKATYPLCVRLILSAMRGAMSMVPILPSVASTLAVWSIELVTINFLMGKSRNVFIVTSDKSPTGSQTDVSHVQAT